MALEKIKRLLQPIKDRIMNMIVEAILSKVDDSKEIQVISVKIGKDEEYSNIERLQSYGLSSNPALNSEVLLISPNGSLENALAVVVENGENRIKDLKTGEVVLYSKFGQKVFLKENGDIDIESATGNVNIKSTTKEVIIESGPGQKVHLGRKVINPLAGVVTGEDLDPVLGIPFPSHSLKVFADKAL